METIETEAEYVKFIENARNPKFSVIYGADFVLLDYEKMFN